MELTIGTRLKTVRKNLRLTQQQVCFEMNIEQPTLSNYEKNHRIPSIEFLIQFSTRYNVSMDYLLGTENSDHLPLLPFDQELIDHFHAAEERDKQIVLLALGL